MSAWADIKKSVNSDLGKEDFLALDEISMMDKEYICSDNLLTKFAMQNGQNVGFKSYAKGYVKVTANIKTNETISIYRGDYLVKQLNYSSTQNLATYSLKLHRGDIINIVYNTADNSRRCDVSILGTLIGHCALREVD